MVQGQKEVAFSKNQQTLLWFGLVSRHKFELSQMSFENTMANMFVYLCKSIWIYVMFVSFKYHLLIFDFFLGVFFHQTI